MFHAKALLALAAAFALYAPTHVSAHGAISIPKVVFLDPPNRNAPSVLVKGTPGPYTGNAVIKDLADSNGSKCGKTDGNAPVQPIPADGIVTIDLSAAHIGPCEFWLDNVKVASAKECAKEYADRKIKVDFSSCKSAKCQLRWVWLATHNDPWEIFDNCVNVGGGGGGGGSTPAATPAMTTVKPTSAPAPENPNPTPAPQTTKKPTQAPAPAPAPVPAPDNDAPGTVKPPSGQVRGIDGSDALNWWCKVNCEMGFCPAEKCIQG